MSHYSKTIRLRNFKQLTLFATPGSPTPDTNYVQAMIGGRVVGTMVIEAHARPARAGSGMYNPPGSIRRVDVDAKYRRQGIATAMWHFAKESGFDPNHGSQQTNDGRAWASTVGKHSQPEKNTVVSRIVDLWKRSGGRPW